MIRGCEFVYIYNDPFIPRNVVAHVIDIVDNYIITKITTDDRTIVKSNLQTYIMVFKKNIFKFADPVQTKKVTVLNKIWIKWISN